MIFLVPYVCGEFTVDVFVIKFVVASNAVDDLHALVFLGCILTVSTPHLHNLLTVCEW